jgi:hypothetical protein
MATLAFRTSVWWHRSVTASTPFERQFARVKNGMADNDSQNLREAVVAYERLFEAVTAELQAARDA